MREQPHALVDALKKAGGALQDAGVPFMLGGGLACWARGAHETEHDVDLFVRPEDAELAVDVLAAVDGVFRGLPPGDPETERRLETSGDARRCPRMADELRGRKIAFLATDMVEQVELTRPLDAVRAAGAEAELISLEPGEIQAFNHYDKADRFRVDETVEEVATDDYDGLVPSRKPRDLDAFCSKLIEELAEGYHEGRRRWVHEGAGAG